MSESLPIIRYPLDSAHGERQAVAVRFAVNRLAFESIAGLAIQYDFPCSISVELLTKKCSYSRSYSGSMRCYATLCNVCRGKIDLKHGVKLSFATPCNPLKQR